MSVFFEKMMKRSRIKEEEYVKEKDDVKRKKLGLILHGTPFQAYNHRMFLECKRMQIRLMKMTNDLEFEIIEKVKFAPTKEIIMRETVNYIELHSSDHFNNRDPTSSVDSSINSFSDIELQMVQLPHYTNFFDLQVKVEQMQVGIMRVKRLLDAASLNVTWDLQRMLIIPLAKIIWHKCRDESKNCSKMKLYKEECEEYEELLFNYGICFSRNEREKLEDLVDSMKKCLVYDDNFFFGYSSLYNIIVLNMINSCYIPIEKNASCIKDVFSKYHSRCEKMLKELKEFK